MRSLAAFSLSCILLASGCVPAATFPAGSATQGRRGLLLPGPSIADRWTTTRIRGKFAVDYLVDADDVGVTTVDGVVMLRGAVRSRAARKRAIALARETKGVRQVISRLKLVRGI